MGDFAEGGGVNGLLSFVLRVESLAYLRFPRAAGLISFIFRACVLCLGERFVLAEWASVSRRSACQVIACSTV